MKITIEPTEDNSYLTCSISIKGDDHNLPDVFEKLVIPSLLGFGFTQDSIDKYLGD